MHGAGPATLLCTNSTKQATIARRKLVLAQTMTVKETTPAFAQSR
jgi:hypothetical protein